MKLDIWHQVQQKIRSIRSLDIRSLKIQSTTLKLLALGLAALVGVLILGGIQAIARVDSVPTSATEFVVRPIPSAPPIANALPTPSGLPGSQLKTERSQPPASPAAQSPSPRNPPPAGSPPASSPSPQVRPTSPQPATQPAAQPATQPATQPAARPAPVVAPSPAAAPALAPITPVFAAPNPALTVQMPIMANAPADPTNYGDRYATDIYGRPVNNALLVVLHETVGTASSALNTMQVAHPNEDDQVSYHSIIKRDGTVIYVVAPEKRAFGAGNSIFNGANGSEAVKTHKDFPPSVNNFAYHISLESPSDGGNSAQTHSGYSSEQYQSLAWLIAWTNVPYDRITTHRAVDQSGSRIDPRSFDGDQLAAQLQKYASATTEP